MFFRPSFTISNLDSLFSFDFDKYYFIIWLLKRDLLKLVTAYTFIKIEIIDTCCLCGVRIEPIHGTNIFLSLMVFSELKSSSRLKDLQWPSLVKQYFITTVFLIKILVWKGCGGWAGCQGCKKVAWRSMFQKLRFVFFFYFLFLRTFVIG